MLTPRRIGRSSVNESPSSNSEPKITTTRPTSETAGSIRSNGDSTSTIPSGATKGTATTIAASRHWPTPLGPRTVIVARTSKHVRIALALLAFAVVVLASMVALLVLWVADLKNTRDHEAAARQAAINSTFCQVLAELPANPALDRIRVQLHCPPTGVAP